MKTVALTFCLLLMSCVCQSETLRLVADAWKPMTGDDLPHQGFSIHLARMAFEEMGHELKVEFQPWSRIIKTMDKDKYDIISAIWYNEDRNQKMVFSEPYEMNRIVFISDSNRRFEYSGPDSLKGMRIGMVSAYSYPKSVMNLPGVKYIFVPDSSQSIKMLSKDRIDLTLGDSMVMRYKAGLHLDVNEALFFDDNHPVTDTPLYLTITKRLPNHKELMDGFNKMVRKYKKDGTYLKLQQVHGLR